MQIEALLQRLNATDLQRFAEAQAQTYPADGATCNLKCGWSFNNETQMMRLDINYLVSATAAAQKDADVIEVFRETINAATPKAIETLYKNTDIFISCSEKSYHLTEIQIFSLQELGVTFSATIAAKCIVATIDELKKLLNIK